MLQFPFRISSSSILAIIATACAGESAQTELVGGETLPAGSMPSFPTTAVAPDGPPGPSAVPGASGTVVPPSQPVAPASTSGDSPSTSSSADLTDPDTSDAPGPDGMTQSDDTDDANAAQTDATLPPETADEVDGSNTSDNDVADDSEASPAPSTMDSAPAEPSVDPDSSDTADPPPVGFNTGGAGPERQYEVQFVGNITTHASVRSDFMNYWDQITPENEGKWDAMEPNRDQMNWGTVDQIYDFAQSNGIPFKGHTLVWGSQEPGWIGGLSEAEQREEVEEWIRLFCDRYPGATMIDVVNEPDHRPPTFRHALGGEGSTGYDWIIWSFEKARQHCPNAKLILNDYNVLRYDTENFLKIARVVQDAGYLEAIGCQAHTLEDQPQAELERNLEKIAELGVPIYISEYDIDLADDEEQLAVMQRQFPLFYESGWVEGITLWGYIHGSTWVPNSGLIRNNSPRPAMTWLMDYLGK